MPRMLPAVLAALAFGCGVSVISHMREVKRSAGVRYFLGGGSNSLVLDGTDGAFVSDAKMGNYTREMKHAIGRRVSRLLLTHSHSDHVAGLPQFEGTPVVIVHPNTKKRLDAQGAPHAPYVEVSDALHLWIGDEDVWIRYAGRGHTDGDLVALLPKERLLVTGDLYVQGFAPVIDVSAGGSAVEFERTLARLLSYDFDEVLPGHGEPVKRAELERFHAYLKDMKGLVADGIAKGETEDAVAARVTLPAYEDYGSLLGLSSREKNVRQMYQELSAARKAP